MRPLVSIPAVLAVLISGCSLFSGPSPGPALVRTVHLLPANSLVLAERQSQALTATVLDSTWVAMDQVVLWESDGDTVATVSDDGVVTAIRAGTANITARAQEQSATVAVTVVRPMVVAISQLHNDSTPSGTASSCVYQMEARPSGGAPGDSATWAPSQIEFLDSTNTLVTVELSESQLVDWFEASVMRKDRPLTSIPNLATPVKNTRIVNRIRYRVGEELHSVGVPIECPTDPTGKLP